MGKSWDDVKFSGENRVRLNELIKIVNYQDNSKFREYRFFGDLVPYAQIWLPIYKDGKPLISQKGKPVRIPFNITNFDPETGNYDKSVACPFVETAEKMLEYIKDEEDRKQLNPSTGFFAQAISRKLQSNPDKDGRPSKQERSTGFKESLDSESFTPVEVHQLNYTIGQGLESAKELNKHKDKKTGERVEKSIADPKYGCDIQIKYDKDGKGQGKYKVNKGEASRLTEEETKYLIWDIVGGLKETTLSRKEAKIEAKRILDEFMKGHKKKKKGDDDSPDVDAPDDIEDTLDRKSSKKKSSKKQVDSDDSPSPDIDDSPDLDSSPSPDVKKSSKKKSSKKASPDSEDSEDSPDASPDESPSPDVKKSSKKKSSSKKKADSDDSPSPDVKKSSKKKSSSKKKDDSEDSEDDSPEIDLDAMEDDDD